LLSRNVKDLSAWFPEVVQAGNALPSNTLLDGEIVIADDGGCSDVGALQVRTPHGCHLSSSAAHAAGVAGF
jgi:ATP-dependent DNA ligase